MVAASRFIPAPFSLYGCRRGPSDGHIADRAHSVARHTTCMDERTDLPLTQWKAPGRGVGRRRANTVPVPSEVRRAQAAPEVRQDRGVRPQTPPAPAEIDIGYLP